MKVDGIPFSYITLTIAINTCFTSAAHSQIKVIDLTAERRQYSGGNERCGVLRQPPVSRQGRQLQAAWRCYPKAVSGGFPLGTTCYSSCFSGAAASPGTEKKVRCYRKSWDKYDTAKWTPKPLVCNEIACSSSDIYPVEHGRWNPEKCMIQKKLSYLTMCTLRCDEFYRRESRQFQTQCVEGGFTYPKSSFHCVMQDGIAEYVEPKKPEVIKVQGDDIINDAASDIKNENAESEAAPLTGEEVESGAEWAAQDLRNRVKAAMGNNEKQKEEIHQARKEAFQKHEEQFQKQEQQEREEHVAKNSKLKEWEKQHYAQAQKDYKASQRLEAQVKSGEVLLVAPLPTDWRSKMEGKHKIDKDEEVAREEIREGEREIAQGLRTVVESSSPLVIIALCTAVAGTILGVVITACYFNRKRTADYTLLNSNGEQLVPMDVH